MEAAPHPSPPRKMMIRMMMIRRMKCDTESDPYRSCRGLRGLPGSSANDGLHNHSHAHDHSHGHSHGPTDGLLSHSHSAPSVHTDGARNARQHVRVQSQSELAVARSPLSFRGEGESVAATHSLHQRVVYPRFCSSRVLNEFSGWSLLGRIFIWPLLTFGRVPLMFYLTHWYILAAGAAILHSFSDGLWLAYVPLAWIALLTIMFFLAAPYAAFKERQGPDSLWRFL